MAYNKQTFSPGQTLMAEDLNKMSEGIASKLEFVDVEALPTENVDENSVYRVKKLGDFTYWGYTEEYIDGPVILAEITKEDMSNVGEYFSTIIVDSLPETGEDFINAYLNNKTWLFYYDKSQNQLFVYSGETSSNLFGTDPNVFYDVSIISNFMSGMNFVLLDTVNDIPPYDENNPALYLVKKYADQYFISKNGTIVELLTSDTAKEYIPEKHLYEWSVSIMGSHDNGNHTNFQFNYITDETPVGSINEEGLYDAKEILDQIGRKTTNYIVQLYYFTACGEYNNTTNRDSIVQYFIIRCIDLGSYNYSVRVIKSDANTDYYIDATTLAAMSAYVACRQIF